MTSDVKIYFSPIFIEALKNSKLENINWIAVDSLSTSNKLSIDDKHEHVLFEPIVAFFTLRFVPPSIIPGGKINDAYSSSSQLFILNFLFWIAADY